MRIRVFSLLMAMLLVASLAAIATAQTQTVGIAPTNELVTIKPNYLPPSETMEFLGVRVSNGRNVYDWGTGQNMHSVEIKANDMANLIILSGSNDDVDYVRSLIEQADVPPRQIEIEVQIVEISKSKALNAGIDWDNLVRYSSIIRPDYIYSRDIYKHSPPFDKITTEQRRVDFLASTNLNRELYLLDQAGASKIHDAPRILTLNNQPAQILDGQRVTYVTRYSSFTNLYETQTMDAGLTLNVLPSLGESGYISLHVSAELTTLGASISDSPVKSGQMIDNTIIAKDGEPVVLGGLTKMVKSSSHRRFPVLGYVLPFLFSHKITSEEEVRSYIILTPHVVDFNTTLDDETKKIIEDN